MEESWENTHATSNPTYPHRSSQRRKYLIFYLFCYKFDVSTLSGKVDLNKRMQKAQRKQYGIDQTIVENVKLEFETLNPSEDVTKSFNGAAHMT